ncbi:MAG: polymer-forming cytoskeletal protein [Rhodospirillales bacterium]|nr:polymer-forming cytoskeletal protein [Rhodospirillales bacterium]
MFSKSDEKTKAETHAGKGEPARAAAPSSATPSIISADLKVLGNLESAGDLQIDGQVEGDIKSRSVTVGEGAHVKGSISAESVRVCGAVSGQIRASSVTIAQSARIKGDVFQKTLSIEAGADLEGRIGHLDSEQSPGQSAGQSTGARPPHEDAAKAAQAAVAASKGAAGSKPAVG